MQYLSRQQLNNRLRAVRAPPHIVRAVLGDYGQENSSTFPQEYGGGGEAFNAPTAAALQARETTGTPTGAPVQSFAVYPFSISVNSGTNGAVSIIPANPRRTLLLIQNQSAAQDLYVNLSGDAGLNNGLLLVAGQGVFFDVVCPYNAVSLYFGAATNEPGIVIEGAPLQSG